MLKLHSYFKNHLNSKQKNILRQCMTTATTNGNHFDIVVAGGGMVGSTMALALGKNPKLKQKKILLLEGRPKKEFTLSENFSNRVSALNITTHDLLTSLNVWNHISKARFAPVTSMQVWDGCSDAVIIFNYKDFSKNLAYIVENNLILSSVEKELSETNVNVLHSAKIKSFKLPKLTGELSEIVLENNESFTCKLLIGADGANSRVRESMGVHFLKWNYAQKSIVANIELVEATPNTVAWQRFNPDGPVALLPLSDNQSSLVWSTSTENARRLRKLSDAEFLDEINEAFFKKYPSNEMVTNFSQTMTNFLRKFDVQINTNRQLPPHCVRVLEGSRASFPVTFGHCANYVDKRVALIGDAAHQVHPLAGQGVNLGFNDVAVLSELIGESVYRGEEIGSNMNVLKDYERKSQIHNVPMVFGIDALNKLYSTNFTPLVLIRSLGLQLVNSIEPLKELIMKRAG